ncbi:MAG: hydantoinase/carbamoylase family amidase [Xanthobacteraceae bacterium]|nr:hydantoinase/carbamoylase family amidase [Xanthobacteraceae bacterium]
MIAINPERLLSDLRALARIGQYQTGVDRIAFSPADLEARQWMAARFREAGLETAMDRFGTVYGAAPGVEKAVLIGSHTDTVPRGGWLDGALGVIYALEIARAALEGGGGPVGIDAVDFQDEEGTYLPCLGSRAMIGDIDEAALSAARRTDGHKLTDALAAAGLIGEPRRLDPKRQIAFLEAHIEQGPRLEHSGNKVAIITGIVGIRRMRVTSEGRADHAGTTPMGMREDALTPLLRLGSFVADRFPKLASADTVWNIGRIDASPGAANVVPAGAQLTLEFRDPDVDLLGRLETAVADEIVRLNRAGAKVASELTARLAPTPMDGGIADVFEQAARDLAYGAERMPSGAGHDAMFLARRIPTGMVFVPSIGGRSHDIAENTRDEDIVAGCQVMARAAERLVRGA